MTGSAAPRPAPGGIGGVLTRYFERGTGGQTGDVGRAASAAKAFLAFSALLTAAFTVFFAAYDFEGMRPSVIVGAVSVFAGCVGLWLVHRGRQLTGSIIAVTVGTGQVAFVTTYIGWVAGFQLYLVAGGQLVFMLFTERQRALRLAYVVLAIATFFYCQLVVPERGAGYTFPEGVYGVLFSINATITLLLMFLLAAASHYGALQARSEAAEAAERAESLANTDQLTGLANRRPVLRRLEELSASVPYVVGIGDLDHFKQVNDTFGHDCGDLVLAAVGERLKGGLRAGDSVGRWGGEEFIFVMEQSALDDAVAAMERLIMELASPIPCKGHSHEVTMSVGLTDVQPDRMVNRALQRADLALYEAKESGRNTVHASVGPTPVPGTEAPPRRRRA
ncbi:MAG: GGDEF domain-containing protein [Actinomycetota bacterium]